MHVAHQLTIVAFVRSTGGRIRLLLAVDRAGVPVADGEPLLLFVHRPGTDPARATMEGPDGLEERVVTSVRDAASTALAARIDTAFDATGEFRGEQLLGVAVDVQLHEDAFVM